MILKRKGDRLDVIAHKILDRLVVLYNTLAKSKKEKNEDTQDACLEEIAQRREELQTLKDEDRRGRSKDEFSIFNS